MRKPPKRIRIEAGRYKFGDYLILDEKRYQDHEDRGRGWRVWRINYEVTLNTREHREGAQTELEAFPTLKQAVASVVEEMRLEARISEPNVTAEANREDPQGGNR